MTTPAPSAVAVGAAVAVLAGAMAGYGQPRTGEAGPGVPRTLASHRAATVSDLHYDVRFTVPNEPAAPITGRVTASFQLAEAGPVTFDFAQPAEHVQAVRAGGEPIAFEAREEHVIVPAAAIPRGRVAIEIEFTAGDGSLNRQPEFLYTLFVPDRARVAFPLFDQPNLKARFRLQLDLPAEWRAVANGSTVSREVRGDRATITFAETEPISSYLFAFAAGEFRVEEAERGGRRMAMYHRETDGERIARNAAAIFDLHASALAWLEEYTGIPYPFEKLDFVLVPAFQYGGMEHPGAIYYRADGLLLDASATEQAHLARASVIAHETAHQWFGNLVTMEWFDDVWMKETFANFLAAKIVNPAFPEVDHDLRFLLAHYPAAYGVDRTAGANPIRQPLDNLDEAGTLYGAIIYQKAPIVVAHLERLMGEAALQDGLRAYLADHADGNASWSDLVALLDPRTDEDLAAWSRTWVDESGRPRIDVDLATRDGAITHLALRQTDPAGRGRVWNQRLEVVLGYPGNRRDRIDVHLRERRVEVPEAVGRPAPDYILANGGALGYGLIALDPPTRDHLLANLPDIDDSVIRAVGWISLWESLLEGEVDPEAFVELAHRSLALEPVEQNVSRILGYLTTAFWRHLAPERRAALAPGIEALLWERTVAAGRRSLAAACFRAYRDVALTDAALARLARIWRQEESVPNVPLSERDLAALAQALAVRGMPESEAMLAAQLDRMANPDRRAAFAFAMPALSGDPDVRDGFFDSLRDPANRAREPWVLTALGFLHHPLRAREAERYIRPSLDLLEEIQRTGDIFFPERWLHATLGGHQSTRAAAIVERFLTDRSDLPPRLRAKALQAADGLLRAARIVDGYRSP